NRSARKRHRGATEPTGFISVTAIALCHCGVTAAVFSQIAAVILHWQRRARGLRFLWSGRGAAGIEINLFGSSLISKTKSSGSSGAIDEYFRKNYGRYLRHLGQRDPCRRRNFE